MRAAKRIVVSLGVRVDTERCLLVQTVWGRAQQERAQKVPGAGGMTGSVTVRSQPQCRSGWQDLGKPTLKAFPPRALGRSGCPWMTVHPPTPKVLSGTNSCPCPLTSSAPLRGQACAPRPFHIPPSGRRLALPRPPPLDSQLPSSHILYNPSLYTSSASPLPISPFFRNPV